MKKVCVITGGGSGIGFAAAKVFGQQGYYISYVPRHPPSFPYPLR